MRSLPVPVGTACCLTTCASGAGHQARARTNLRFRSLATGRPVPERSAGLLRPVGCMRLLGGALPRELASTDS
jgi:hypothetical protein